MFVLAIATLSIGQEYVLSPDSEIKFVAKHLGVFNVKGKFTKVSGKLVLINEGLSGVGTIVVNSIDTGNKSRDKKLISQEFLDAETFPEITFKVVEAFIKDNISMIKGSLCIKEKSFDIIIPYDIVQTGRGVLIEFETVIDRTNFELYFDSLDGLVGNEVKLYSYLLFDSE